MPGLAQNNHIPNNNLQVNLYEKAMIIKMKCCRIFRIKDLTYKILNIVVYV